MKYNKMIKNSRVFIFTVLILTLFSAGSGMCAEPKKVAIVPFTMNSAQDIGYKLHGFSHSQTFFREPFVYKNCIPYYIVNPTNTKAVNHS